MITLTITPLLPLSFFSQHLFYLHFTVSLLLFLSLFLSNSSFPKRPSFFPLSLFFASLPLSFSIILIFQSSVTKPSSCHHFRPKTTGSLGELHTAVCHLKTFLSCILIWYTLICSYTSPLNATRQSMWTRIWSQGSLKLRLSFFLLQINPQCCLFIHQKQYLITLKERNKVTELFFSIYFMSG